MSQYTTLLASFALYTPAAIAQQPSPTSTLPPPVHLTAEQDHQRTMDLLQITNLRPGRSGNPDAPNAANYDESKANPFPDLPDPLLLNSGKKVTSPKMWWNQRRPEIVEYFDREIYQRFAIAYVSSSGEGGAKLNRRDWGEIVENVAGTNEYHWMAGNFLKYAGPLQWKDLPVDAHEFIALCAPRPVFIGGGATKGDGWADAQGMFMAASAASPVYQLLGKKGLDTTTFPAMETPLIEGDLAFRQHGGGHTPAPNWPTFITFASRYLNAPPARSSTQGN